MGDDELQLLLASMDSMNQSVMNATNIVATQNLNKDNRKWQGEEAEKARRWSSKEAELAYQRQQEYYDTNLSPSARVRQYEEAGLNPALLYGGASSTASSSAPQASGVSSPSGSASPFPGLSLFSMLEAIMSIQRQKAEVNNIDADTREIEERTKGYEGQRRLTDVGVDKVIAEIDKLGVESEKIFQDIRESVKRMDLMDNQIKVGDSVIELNGSQSELAAIKAAAQKLDNEKAKVLLPYVAQREEAEIAYQNAKTDEAKYSAEGLMYDANLSMLKVLVEQDMIDKGYYDSVREQAQWSAKYKKREYKWKPVNDIVSGVSKLVLAGASAVSAATGAGAFTTAPVVTTPPTMNFW